MTRYAHRAPDGTEMVTCLYLSCARYPDIKDALSLCPVITLATAWKSVRVALPLGHFAITFMIHATLRYN